MKETATFKDFKMGKTGTNWEFYKYKSLSEDFIREYQDKVDWGYISEYQSLSEDFIREFKDRVAWDWISECQVLSEDFIREFIREFKDKL